MDEEFDNPQLRAKQAVVAYWNGIMGQNEIDSSGVLTVWYCFILGGWKTLMFINSFPDNYFEVTYNSSKNEMYLDHYKKVHNEAIPDDVNYLIADLRKKLSR